MTKNRYVLTITLNPAIDKTMVIPDFKRGKINRPNNISLSAGGKGINVSKVFSQLGINTVASGFLPCKGADFIELELLQKKIRHHFVKINGDIRTNLTIINPASKRATRIFEPGGIVRRRDLQSFQQQYQQLLKKASAVVVSGSNALGVPHSLNGKLIALANREGILTVLDSSLEPLKLGIKKKPFLIKPNLHEAESFLNSRLRSKADIIRALKELHHQGPRIVALTDGKEGAFVYNGKQIMHARPPVIDQKNPVGCGDAFVAGFLAAYFWKKDFWECVRYASACGCVNAMSYNPGEVSYKAIQKILKKITLADI